MPRMSLLATLRSGRTLVGDGAWGTELLKRGLPPGACPELWCLSHPEALRDIALGYLAAGADLLETNSFGANVFRLESYGLQGRASVLARAAAQIGREAIEGYFASLARGSDARKRDKPLLVGSMGPSGLAWGLASPQALESAFSRQAEALASGGADALCVETAMDAREAAIAVRAAKEAVGLETICSYSFVLGPDGTARTIAGQSLRGGAAAALAAGADILGANCGSGFEETLSVFCQLSDALRELGSRAPIMVSPNAGLPVDRGGIMVYPDSPEAMEAFVEEAIKAGAAIVGGCCGTGPAHVAAIRRAVDRIKS